MALLVIRLHPSEPISGIEFRNALNGLSIEAFELSSNNPNGVSIGTATYIVPAFNASPGPLPLVTHDPATRIVQHFGALPVGLGVFSRVDYAVGTAVINIPAGAEYQTADIRLAITRAGGSIIHNQKYYNVPVQPGAMPGPVSFQGLSETSLHLALPLAGLSLGPGDAFVNLPEDGTPPNYETLRRAVLTVLDADPGGIVDANGEDPADTAVLAGLTIDQCRHIAFEIAWNRGLFPLPDPPRSLEAMYTDPPNNDPDDDEERDRRIFEGNLQSYYALHNATAEKLSQYIFSLAAAAWAEMQSSSATRVFYRFPVTPGLVSPDGKIGLTQLILQGAGGGVMNPAFRVTANFFYALGADFPVQIDPARRYQIAIREQEGTLKEQLVKAIEKNVINAPAGADMTQWQAVRRLLCLYVFDNSTLTVQVVTDAGHIALLTGWLNFPGEDIDGFWSTLSAANQVSHLDLMLRALSRIHNPLIAAVPAAGGANATIVAGWDEDQWRAIVDPKPAFGGNIANIPPFILPGSDEERVGAFLRYIKKFFDPASSFPIAAPLTGSTIPGFGFSQEDPLSQLLAGGFNFTTWDGTQAAIQPQLDSIFPGDAGSQSQFAAWLNCIRGVLNLSAGIAPAEVQFSVMEALWARGITSEAIVNQFSLENLTEALSGSVAYDFAATIWGNAGEVTPGVPSEPAEFVPVNPDGSLVNCIPPAYRSPLGPVAYLFDLLRVSEDVTCETPIAEGAPETLATLLAGRRGDIYNKLQASNANLEIPIPLIDLVNESLEGMVITNTTHGAIFNTPAVAVGGHELTSNTAPTPGAVLHAPETLLEVLPAFSTPMVDTTSPSAYDILENDFSAPELPYSQAHDINCSYLKAMKTCRYEAVRRFRKNITEFVLDPALEPAGFRKHLWRYPVRIEVAKSYFCMSEAEYAFFTGGNAGANSINFLAPGSTSAPGATGRPVYEWYGFVQENSMDPRGEETHWTTELREVPEFLDRTGLTYCEFVELWKSEFVAFHNKDAQRSQNFPECEPCCPDHLEIEFSGQTDPELAFYQLIVFIRLWRKLKESKEASCGCKAGSYSFTELRDICKVLELFRPDGTLNPDFMRQLLAFQMLRDDFNLALTDGSDTSGMTDAERTHLLAFWAPGASRLEWAQQHLLDQIQQFAQTHLKCKCREPEFIKLLLENLEQLSLLAGFEPGNNHWRKQPAKTLRFAEILAKIYASKFTVGDLIFLFTASPHLQGDDPFPLQTDNEAKDTPFGLPDDDPNSLYALRRKLMAAEPGNTDTLDWHEIEAALRDDLGMDPSSQSKLVQLAWHLFPGVMQDSGVPPGTNESIYRANLPLASPTSAAMWNTPANGPFQWISDSGGQLTAKIPLTDEAVIEKLARISPLNAAEQTAVQSLYFQPRIELAQFAFLFENFAEAEERLLQEADETVRWDWFKKQFALCQVRSKIIASHIAAHVSAITGQADTDGEAIARLILNSLWADENTAHPANPNWEDDNGAVPGVLWPNRPGGGAWAALLGLVGTGMKVEYSAGGTLRWSDVRGGTTAFGPEENAWNAPIPSVLPGMSFVLPNALTRYISVRNGFAFSNADDTPLGGAESFQLHWNGLLLIEQDGPYAFMAGLPSPDGERPDFEGAAHHHQWKVTLARGQKSWVLLSHEWKGEEAPGDCSKAIALRKGMYELAIELVRKPVDFNDPEDVCPQTTGFQLKYLGPDSENEPRSIPLDKLFQEKKNDTLKAGTQASGELAAFLEMRYTSTVRDIRRTYLRAYKATLFAHRLGLSAKQIADSGQSELGYLLGHPDKFAGQSYYDGGGVYLVHKANFDFNFFPIADNYFAPTVAQDERAAPSLQRQAALFDWWERLFDYTVMRQEANAAPEHPVWLMFHESSEQHPDDIAQLLRHLGIPVNHADIVQRYNDNPNLYELNDAAHPGDLDDDRWAVRAWKAELWLRDLNRNFSAKDIRTARPDLWASLDPNAVQTYDAGVTGNMNLTRFYRDGCIEHNTPMRYEKIKPLNDGLRERGRKALTAYLTHLDRVALPWGGFATEARHLSALLLHDVESGICQKASRIEEAVSVVQLYVQRARLGLESDLTISEQFILAWDRHFATFSIWEACKRRDIYRENWIEWEELQTAQQSETFQFLDSKLREATLTAPIPAGLAYWNGTRLPRHDGLALLQQRQPSTIEVLAPHRDGLGLLGTPDRHARPSWLAPLKTSVSRGIPVNDDPDGQPDPNIDGMLYARAVVNPGRQTDVASFPLWFQAAVRLGRKFIRVAAAGLPGADTDFAPKCAGNKPTACCETCGQVHPALLDEYYFWIEPSEYYRSKEQNADWGKTEEFGVSDWNRDGKLPELLHWNSDPMVHLHWCRVHNGEFQQHRQSYEGVRVSSLDAADLVYAGRIGDSLRFEITTGQKPIPEAGYPNTPPPGFRYDMAPDEAIILPEVVPSVTPALVGGLAAYPFFAFFEPGAPLLPPSMYSPAIIMAGHLRAHCQFETAIKWYELVYQPLSRDNTWMVCSPAGSANDPNYIAAAEPGNRTDDCCCASRPVNDQESKNRAILLHYLETLLQWGDALLKKNTPESFQHARLLFETAARIAGSPPESVLVGANPADNTVLSAFKPDCAPLNPRLSCLYCSIDDRLSLIHHCLNAMRLRNGRQVPDMPYFGDSRLRECWKTNDDHCRDENGWCLPQSPYRFIVLMQKAQEIAGEVRTLGGALLSAYEKMDAEFLANMRSMHERQLLELSKEVRQLQWREADWQVQALYKTKEIALTRLQYYKDLIANGLKSGEDQYVTDSKISQALRDGAKAAEISAGIMQIIPDIYAGFPVTLTHIPVGTKLAEAIFQTVGRFLNGFAERHTTNANLELTKAGWERREEEWKHQVNVLTIEVQQIERQILASERRRDIALRELNNHVQQIENAAEVQDFLRDKFTNHALYLWMQQETAALHYTMYELALHCALQAQRAFNFERGHLARNFIAAGTWDNLHEGLLAGEKLSMALRQMEKAYYDENVRDYELTKHVSLRLHAPEQLMQLRKRGYCEVELPEWLFDLDYPGHYMRRIKNVTLTIPCVVGPYTGIHCRLTLLSSRTRISPKLCLPPHDCCNDKNCNGYDTMPDDPRVVNLYAATEAIATSSGQNDSGMFELNFRDERYLPFEYAGTVSRWRIELPHENNYFEMDTLTDVVMHLNYMAREGGNELRRAANGCAQKHLPGEGIRFFDVKQEMTDAWYLFQSDERKRKELSLSLNRQMFPFLPGNSPLWMEGFDLLFETGTPCPADGVTVQFKVDEAFGELVPDECDGDILEIHCVRSPEWPNLYHGTLSLRLGPVPTGKAKNFGSFIFPVSTGKVNNVFYLVGYAAGKMHDKKDCC